MNGSDDMPELGICDKKLQRCFKPHRPQYPHATKHKQRLIDGDDTVLVHDERAQRLAVQMVCIVVLVKGNDFAHHVFGQCRGKIQRKHDQQR